MSDTDRPQGRTMKELRAILDADNQRWSELAELWEELLEHEQVELIETARAMARPVPVPQSLRA